jgi:hypothetical protein
MRTIGIVFTKSKKKCALGSFLIRLWTKKPYSHVAAKFFVYLEANMYYQASEGRVNYESDEVFHSKHEVVKEYKITLPEEFYREVSLSCLRNAGKPYGFWQNIGIAVIDILRKICPKKHKNKWSKGYNCSELLYSLVFKKIIVGLDKDPQLVKPEDIEEIIVKKLHYHSDGTYHLLKD